MNQIARPGSTRAPSRERPILGHVAPPHGSLLSAVTPVACFLGKGGNIHMVNVSQARPEKPIALKVPEDMASCVPRKEIGWTLVI